MIVKLGESGWDIRTKKGRSDNFCGPWQAFRRYSKAERKLCARKETYRSRDDALYDQVSVFTRILIPVLWLSRGVRRAQSGPEGSENWSRYSAWRHETCTMGFLRICAVSSCRGDILYDLSRDIRHSVSSFLAPSQTKKKGNRLLI